jgi:hypothetical protein
LLIAAYITVLYKANIETNISTQYYALGEVNKARLEAGLSPLKLDATTVKQEALSSANEYRKLLKDKGGSYVVVQKGVTEELVFKDWLNGLKSNTKDEIVRIFDKATLEGWNPAKLKNELSKIEELIKNKRASAAAFTETRVAEHQTRMHIWKRGEVRLVQRHVTGLNSCHICQDMDGEIYEIDDAPPLSHFSCKCIYSIFSF